MHRRLLQPSSLVLILVAPTIAAALLTNPSASLIAAFNLVVPSIAANHNILLSIFITAPSFAAAFSARPVVPSIAGRPAIIIDPRQDRLHRRHLRRHQMADQAALAAALAQLAAAINNLPNAGGAVPPAPNPILDPLADNNALDLGSRAGETAFKQVCAKLDTTWDGTPAGFPPCLTAARVRAREGRWDAAGNTGICTVAGNNIFTAYHQITEAQATAAFQARLNDRAVQNAKAFFRALKQSITGTLHATLFGQFANAPTNEDGVFLWIRLTRFTITSSIHLSVTAFQEILEFSPEVHNYHIPTINTKLLHLFVLATTPHRQVGQPERIQHTVTVYGRIQQPQSWATWVSHQIDRIEEGAITNHQDFMNAAALKYAKIHAKEGGFHASTNTIQEDIVAMMAKAKRSRNNAPRGGGPDKDGTANDTATESKRPPFLKHYKVSEEANAKKFKVGDTKVWNGVTYHYCDSPNHRGRIRWHKHKAEECSTRKKWLAKQNEASPEANVGAAETGNAEPEAAQPAPDQPDVASDASALLANAYALLGTNSAVQELVADALTALADADE